MADTQVENGGASQESGEQPQKQVNGGAEPGKEDRKLFVGGLSPGTTEDQLKTYFQKYGDVENINVKTDPNTGRSRGFAFISFASADTIAKVLSAGVHTINNKKVDAKKAKARIGKVFVGGLVPEISDADIRTFFSQFGTIVDVETPFDKTKNRRKGFCFISFESEQVANELLKRPKQTINGKQVDVKRVNVKPNEMGGGMRGGGRGGGRGGMMGAGGGYGGYGGYDLGAYKAYGRYDYYDGGYAADYAAYDYPSSAGYGSYGSSGGGYSGGKQMGRGRQVPRQQPY